LKALINNAGLYERKTFFETKDEDWERQWRTNLQAPVELCRHLHPLLMKAAPASVVNISSTLGLRPVAQTAAYSATKAALNSLTQTLALEWAPHVRVNAVCPGIVDTPIHTFHELAEGSEVRRGVHEAHPLGRMGRPEHIAAAVDFLLSEDSNWTTGSLWTVDGGIHLL
jgi:NAD(P)-dependent dehydrogenase (short-subunit alcohol dehydrogenase family)